MKKIENLNVTGPIDGPIEIIVREGAAPDNPPKIEMLEDGGDIESPARFYAAKKTAAAYADLWAESYVTASLINGSIELNINERVPAESVTICGQIKINPLLNSLSINTERGYTPRKVAELFRKNRSLFENQNDALELTTYFKNFKASIDTQLESSDDNRGSRKELIEQKISSETMPKSFIPLVEAGFAIFYT